jgi:hypothetical protein
VVDQQLRYDLDRRERREYDECPAEDAPPLMPGDGESATGDVPRAETGNVVQLVRSSAAFSDANSSSVSAPC